MQGLTDEDIEKMEKDPLQAPLDDKDRAMVAFVMKAIKTPDAVEKQDVYHMVHYLGCSRVFLLLVALAVEKSHRCHCCKR